MSDTQTAWTRVEALLATPTVQRSLIMETVDVHGMLRVTSGGPC